MYHFDVNVLHIRVITFVVIIVVLVVMGIGMILYGVKKGFETTYGTRLTFKALPAFMKIIVSIPLIIVTVFTVGLFRLVIQYMAYETKMNSGDGIVVEGSVDLISYEESWYRDSFLGYELSFEIDGTKYVPSNSFPLEVVEKLKQGAECRITYGYMGSELTVWSIDSMSD